MGDPVDSWGVSDGTFQRVTLLGDAAHAMRPSLGLGSTMALQDALSLSKELSKVESLEDSKSVATALRAYESERIGVTAPLQLKARAQGKNQHKTRALSRRTCRGHCGGKSYTSRLFSNERYP